MIIKQKKISVYGFKFFIKDGRQEMARAYLYILKNGLHQRPFGLVEDIFVVKSQRGRGLGTALVKTVITAARKNHCYKLIATSRYRRSEIHGWYKKMGFKDWGREFRMELG